LAAKKHKKSKGVGMLDIKTGAPRVRPANPFLTPVQAGDFVKLSWRTLERMRQRGEGPPFRRHGRYIRYHIDDLEAWSRANTYKATNETPRT
jgi:hypothetical protein